LDWVKVNFPQESIRSEDLQIYLYVKGWVCKGARGSACGNW